jgi:hypothetical protein
MKMESNFNPNLPYCRTEIDEAFKKRKATMQKEALQQGVAYDGKSIALYYDCYTGKMLRGGDRYDYEHIISSESIFMHFRATHTNTQIAEIVNFPKNVSLTLRTINQYKGKYNLQTRILNNPTKIKEFEIDIQLTKSNLLKAEKAVF